MNDTPSRWLLVDGLRWRTREDGLPPSATYISSPHDLEARYASQQIAWIGYKVHFTESVRRVTHRWISAAGGIDSKGGHWVTQPT